MLRTSKFQLLYKGFIPLVLAVLAMALLMWNQAQAEENGAVPWSEWLLLLYGIVVTLAGWAIYQWNRKSVLRSAAAVPPSTMPAVYRAQQGAEKDHELLRQQLIDLTDSKRRLEEQLQTQAKLYKSYRLQPLFLGGIAPSDIETELEALGFDIAHHPWFAILSLQIEPLEQTRFEEKDRELLFYSIYNMLEELIPAAERLVPIRVEHAIVMLVMSRHEAKEKLHIALEGWMASMQAAMDQYMRLKACIGVSRLFQQIEECPSAFQESVRSLQYHDWSQEEPSIYYFEPMASGRPISLPKAHPLELEWLEAVKTGEAARAGILLKQMLRDMYRTASHPSELEISIVRMILHFLDHMRHWGASVAAGMGLRASLLQEVQGLKKADEAEQWFKTMLMEPCLVAIEKTMKSHKRSLLERMLHIIHEEYDTELSLESMAKRLHYNSNYLSGVFNKEMSITFSEYLAGFRHEMARKWLIETELPVKEIAQRLQYKNSQNFIRSFRKNQHMTPGEYRMNYGRGTALQDKSLMPDL